MDEKKPPADILDEIMSRSEKPLPSPVSYPPKFDPPPPEDTPPPAPEEKKPPLAERLLPWLCALLGGAVLTALLLGVQLVSVNARLDGLQGALEEIDALKEDKAKLADTIAGQAEQLTRRESDYQQMAQNWRMVLEEYSHLTYRGLHQNALTYLERFNRAGDWLMSGALVEGIDPYFNQHNNQYNLLSQYVLPSQGSRYLELREEVFQRGGCMVLEGWYTEKDGNYTERPYIGEGSFEEADLKAAKSLLASILYYPTDPDIAAAFFAEQFQPDRGRLERLTAGAFQPSTVELFEQVRADLLAQGFLEEEPDGTLNAVSRGEGRRGPADVPQPF